MRTIVIVAMLVAVVACYVTFSVADSTFTLDSSYSIWRPMGATGQPLAVGSLVQLIWTHDNSAPASALVGMLDGAGYSNLYGDTILFSGASLDMGLPAGPGGGWLIDLDGAVNYGSPNGSNTLPSGWLYGRVFDAPNAGSVTIGTWYAQTPLIQVLNNTTGSPPPLPDQVEYSWINALNPYGGTMLDKQAIPEPASIFMFGAGLGLVAMWRLRRR